VKNVDLKQQLFLHGVCCAVDFECENYFVAIFIILKGYFLFRPEILL